MFRPRKPAPAKKVWRISASNPMGEWVYKTAPIVPSPSPSKELPEVSYGTWVTSSYDLLDGADVIEDPDALSGAMFDELFTAASTGPKSAGQ